MPGQCIGCPRQADAPRETEAIVARLVVCAASKPRKDEAVPASVKADGTTVSAPTPGAPESARVRSMFDAIAPRYDLLNHLLSMNLDHGWRRKAARAALFPGTVARVLDLCCGTGDLAIELARQAPGTRVFGGDFSLAMLARATRKAQRIPFSAADALHLPYRDGVFDAVTMAFGLRNLADRAVGLRELARVLRPGGRAVILEFVPPGRGLIGAAFRFYLHHVLPRVGRAISGDASAYTYLPQSMEKFPPPDALRAEFEAAGFEHASATRMGLNGVVLVCAQRRP